MNPLSPTRRRARVLLVAVIMLAVVVTAGLWAGRRLTTPEQLAASAQPPPPPRLTAKLTTRALTRDIIVRGTAIPAQAVKVTAPLSLGDAPAVVTRVRREPGEKLGDAEVIADVSGYPLLAADLPFPLYRDLQRGNRGPDVDAVVAWLRRLGYLSRDHDTVDSAVVAAVCRLLDERGYEELAAELKADPVQIESSAAAPAGAADAADGPDSATVTPAALVVLSRSWLVLLDRPGRTITRVAIRVGSVIEPSALLLESDEQPPQVRAQVDTQATREIRAGDAAVATDQGSGQTVELKVEKVSPAEGAGGLVLLRPLQPLRGGSEPDGLQVTITTDAAGRVLAAPVTAIRTDGTGASSVEAVDEGTTRTVPVTVGVCAEGYCQVTGDVSDGVEVLLIGTP